MTQFNLQPPLATIMAMLPQSVLGLFTGIFVDRWKRKRDI